MFSGKRFKNLRRSLSHPVALDHIFVQDTVVTLLNIGIHNINVVLGAFQFQLVAVFFKRCDIAIANFIGVHALPRRFPYPQNGAAGYQN
jgi:hypothetical protein